MNKNLLISSAIVTLAFWSVIGVLLYRRHVHEASQEKTIRDVIELDYKNVFEEKVKPCKLQLDKTKPNYNDCGAFTEPVSPGGILASSPTSPKTKTKKENKK